MSGASEVGRWGTGGCGGVRSGTRWAAAVPVPLMWAMLATLGMLCGAGAAAAAEPGAATPPPAGSRQALAAAQELLERQRYAEADAAFAAVSRALAVGDADRVEALSAMGEARLLEGHYKDAFAAAGQAIGESAAGSRETGRARSVVCRSVGHLAAGERPAPPVEGALLVAARGEDGGGGGDAGDAAEIGDPDVPRRIEGRVRKPLGVYYPPPAYTETARKARLQGVVILEAIIDRYGCISRAHVLKPLPMGLDRSALDTVSTWAFEPALLDGHPVRVFYTLTVTFQVEKEPAPPAPPTR